MKRKYKYRYGLIDWNGGKVLTFKVRILNETEDYYELRYLKLINDDSSLSHYNTPTRVKKEKVYNIYEKEYTIFEKFIEFLKGNI